MLLVSHKGVFIKNEVVLQGVTMRERARAFAATISISLFDRAFAITKFSFCGTVFKRILALERGISSR